MSKSSDSDYNNTEVIFEPIKVSKPRDDLRGLRHGEAGPKHGFPGVVEEEEDGVVVIQYGAQPLPSDDEIEEMKQRLRLEDTVKEKESKRFINRIKSLFGCGG